MAGFNQGPIGADKPIVFGQGPSTRDPHHLPKVGPKIRIPNANSYLTFQSFSFQHVAGKSNKERYFNALCGDDPPQIVDGYGKWTVIDRPLRQGVTVPAGFNPAKVKISVRFGVWDARFDGISSDGSPYGSGWDTRSIAADQIESDIDDLHWMAGGNFQAGPSPVVYVDSYSSSHAGNHTKLMPPQYRGIAWVIDGGVEWGNSLRHPNGSRIYQEATFTVLGYTSLGQPPPKQQHRSAGGHFTTTTTRRTALSIAAADSSRAPEATIKGLAYLILGDHRNNPCSGTRLHLRRKLITWPIPAHTKVWVPSHFS